MAYRVNRLDKTSNSNWQPATSYRVIVCEVGAIAAAASSGTTITVDAGHGFAAGDKFLLNPALGASSTFTGTDTVQSVTPTTVVMGVSYSISKGDVLINLGADTGTAAPNYDAAGTVIYSDMDHGDTITSSDITVDSTTAAYEYWTQHAGTTWELFLDSNGVAAGYEIAQLSPDDTYEGFFGVTKVTRPTAITQTYSTTSATHAARTSDQITDNSGGTASTTIAAITGGGAGCENATKNAVASLAKELEDLRIDQVNTASVLNIVIDKLQTLGLLQ